MKDIILNVVLGIVTGLISGYIVTIYYRKKDMEKEFIFYCERLLRYASFLSNTFMPLKLMYMDTNEIIKTLTDMEFPRRYTWLKTPRTLKENSHLVNNLENDCSLFLSNLLEYSNALMWSNVKDTTLEYREQHRKICDEKHKFLGKKWMDLSKDITQLLKIINGDKVSQKHSSKL